MRLRVGLSPFQVCFHFGFGMPSFVHRQLYLLLLRHHHFEFIQEHLLRVVWILLWETDSNDNSRYYKGHLIKSCKSKIMLPPNVLIEIDMAKKASNGILVTSFPFILKFLWGFTINSLRLWLHPANQPGLRCSYKLYLPRLEYILFRSM